MATKFPGISLSTSEATILATIQNNLVVSFSLGKLNLKREVKNVDNIFIIREYNNNCLEL